MGAKRSVGSLYSSRVCSTHTILTKPHAAIGDTHTPSLLLGGGSFLQVQK
jgi:hypothetical protein